MIASITMMAQVTTSSLSGKIVDDKGPPPGATVIATHIPSGSSYFTITNSEGRYTMQGMRVGGPYTVEVRFVGYSSAKAENITLKLGETYRSDFTLKSEAIGLGEVVISSEAEKPVSKTSSTTISSQEIANLPTVNRSITDVVKVSPYANGMSFAGSDGRSTNFTVDGANFNNNFGLSSNLPGGGTPISVDALEEVQVVVAPFDVRQSNFVGGGINAITKSGTNQFHGSAYTYYTNQTFRGNTLMGESLGSPRPEESLLTYGATLGGPIVKDKLFFFVNFEYQSDVDPGQTSFARESEDDVYGGGTQYNRPTVDKMEEISNYLKTTYGYNPGRYQNYSASTPDLKLLARLDWNISDKDKFNIRYSLVRNKYSSDPSSSINPLSSSVYNRNTYGRTSEYALYFESNRYFQEQNFSSVAAEWNHSFASGRGNNMLRATYSHQYEPRSFVGNLFPTVDILETLEDGTPAVYTSFGPDPFTYGNLREVSTAVVTDELSYLTGVHNFTFGAQYEFDNTKNGFMQGGAGYYVYDSWDDFTSNANPRAFAITYGNNEKLEQVYPSFNYMQGSLYAQDEMTLSERFKLALGLRVEVPWYPSIATYNTNKEFLEGWDETVTNEDGTTSTVHHSIADGEGNTMYGMSTADMPKARVNFSPRLGFNWDLAGDRKYILRGGSGLYTGRLPFVWIVSTVGNSNCLQNQYINSNYEEQIKFFDSPTAIINNNSSLLTVGDLPAPQSTTIMDKNLRMPQTWKSSLAFDAELPGGIKATVEGIYNKDITSVAVTKLGIVKDGTVQLPGEPDARMKWKSEGIKNSLGRDVTPYYITNTDKNGYYYSVTGQLSKRFNCGLDLMAAYTYSEGKNVTDGIGDQVTSAYNTNAFGVHGSNVHELGYSSYVTPNRLLLNVGWTWNTGKHTSETIGLYYEGLNLCFVGGYSYTRYSYTMTSNVNGDGGSNSLIYIPTESELASMPFISEENKAEYNTFIKGDKYLSAHRGQYAERGAVVAPWRHTFNFKYERTYKFNAGPSISFGVDVKNIANLFWRGWGNMQRLNTSDIIKLTGNGSEDNPYTYTFNNPTWTTYANPYSTWSAALNLRLNF